MDADHLSMASGAPSGKLRDDKKQADGLPTVVVEMVKNDGIGWIWDDEEDLRRFLKGGLAAK